MQSMEWIIIRIIFKYIWNFIYYCLLSFINHFSPDEIVKYSFIYFSSWNSKNSESLEPNLIPISTAFISKYWIPYPKVTPLSDSLLLLKLYVLLNNPNLKVALFIFVALV